MHRMYARTLISGAVLAIILLLYGVPFLSLASPISQGTTSQERALLSDLFELMLDVHRSAEYRDELDGQIVVVERDIQRLERTLTETEDKYVEARDRAVASLQWLHRMGPTSYLEVLLGASSLRDFLHRVEIVAAATRGSLMALENIQRDRQALVDVRDEKGWLEERLEGLVLGRGALALEKEYLAQQEVQAADILGDRWPSTSSELKLLLSLWDGQALPYLNGLSRVFSRIDVAGVEIEDITVVPSLFTVTIIIPDTSLNRLLAGEPELSGTVFEFVPGEARLVVPDLQLTARGWLDIDAAGLLTYRITGIELSGLPVKDRSLALDRVELDLGPALLGMSPRSITVKENAVEVVVSLFR